jgi:ankyrin repeat protein
MPCSHIDNCELFVQFASNPALEIWKEHYCFDEYRTCARYITSLEGKPAALTMLPNGMHLKVERSTNEVGEIALFNAINKKRIHMIKVLLKSGVDVNAKNMLGKTALMVAVETNFEEGVSILLKHGAEPKLLDVHGNTANDIAVICNHKAILKIFVVHKNIKNVTEIT